MTTLKIKDSIWASKLSVIPFDVDAVTTKALHHYTYDDLLFVLRLAELLQDTADCNTEIEPAKLGKSITVAINAMWDNVHFCYSSFSSNYYKPSGHFLINKLATVWACAKLKIPYGQDQGGYEVIEQLSADLNATLVSMITAGTLEAIPANDPDSVNNLKVTLFNTVTSQYEAGTTWSDAFRLDVIEFIITALANELTSRDLVRK